MAQCSFFFFCPQVNDKELSNFVSKEQISEEAKSSMKHKSLVNSTIHPIMNEHLLHSDASLMAQLEVKNLPAAQEMQVQSLGR